MSAAAPKRNLKDEASKNNSLGNKKRKIGAETTEQQLAKRSQPQPSSFEEDLLNLTQDLNGLKSGSPFESRDPKPILIFDPRECRNGPEVGTSASGCQLGPTDRELDFPAD